MSGSIHRTALEGLCRLCGQSIKRRRIDKQKLSKVIYSSLSLDISADTEDVHPPCVCESCERKLARWKDKIGKRGKKKGGLVSLPDEVNIVQTIEFLPHGDGCGVCTVGQETREVDEAESLLNMCQTVGKKHNMVVQRRAGKVLVISLDEHGNTEKCLSVHQSGRWTVRVYGECVPKDTAELKDIGEFLTAETLPALVQLLSECHICPGNPDYLVPQSAIQHRPVYIHKIPAPHPNTIRHTACTMIVKGKDKCDACRIYRVDLSKLYKSVESTESPAAKTNFRYMKTEKLSKRLKTKQKQEQSLQQKLSKMKAHIQEKFNRESHTIDPHISESFSKVMQKENDHFEKEFAEDSPQRLLWEEQKKRLNRKAKGMRWHPAILRLCIALHAKSSAAYDILRDSGFLHLPHHKTLYHYTHFTDNPPGFNADYINRVCDDVNLKELKDHEKIISLSIDEMKVNEGLVYSQRTGDIIGFTHLGDMNDEMEKYSLKCNDGSTDPKLASHILTLMVRATCASYYAPIAYFATSGATSDQLYYIVSEGIEHLTYLGFKVCCIVSDGAAPNRGLYKILTESSEADHFFVNALTGGRIYLISDTPHLLKTIRNNFENSGYNQKTRNLKFRGLDITWKHILDVYKWDFSSPASLRKLHRLTEEHLHLTPSLRMKVKLAAQVLSSTVANALKAQGRPETASTIRFIEYVDLFFDCMNVSTLYGGQKKRKPALFPYRDQDDWRFTWLLEDFLSFLDEWESEGKTLPLSASEREKLVLSKQTLHGLRITVKSFVSLCKELLAEEGVEYVLSDKFNQDPLEQYFAKQRSVGRQHENPSVAQFGSNMMALQVAGSSMRASKRANVTTASTEPSFDSNPIPKKKLFKGK